MKSATHGWFGAVALNARLTRSPARCASSPEIVVRFARPRTTPRSPCSRIGRSTVQRATGCPEVVQVLPHLAHPMSRSDLYHRYERCSRSADHCQGNRATPEHRTQIAVTGPIPP